MEKDFYFKISGFTHTNKENQEMRLSKRYSTSRVRMHQDSQEFLGDSVPEIS